MITPASLALISEAYHDAVQRGRAIVYWGLGGSVAAAAGPVLGGLLAQIDWRLIFIVNLPVGAVALLVLSRVARSPRRPSPFDWNGQVAAVLALASLTYGIIEGAADGYGSPGILAMYSQSLLYRLNAFMVVQARGRTSYDPAGYVQLADSLHSPGHRSGHHGRLQRHRLPLEPVLPSAARRHSPGDRACCSCR